MNDHCISPRGRRNAALLALASLIFSSGLPRVAGKPASDSTLSYSGRAIAFHVDGVTEPTSGPIVIGDTGPLAATGGVLEQHASDVSIAGGALTIDSVDATAAGVGPETVAATQLTNYHAHFITRDGKDVYITADFIGAVAKVSVNAGGHATGSANVTVQGLTVNGRPIAISGAPNQVVNLPDAQVKLVINEQTSARGQSSGDVAAAAIHFWICECMEGHFGLVSAGISGRGAPPEEHTCGKVTGGGWITGTPTGAKGTFGVSGGVRRGDFWGHLNYIDHGSGLKVESTAVTGFQVDPSDANARVITYDVTINGVAGTATVRVADNGEPGRNDTFAITLSTGYTAGGSLGGDAAGGGNIQVHKCPPGWE
jgi:hypothetical protein